MPPPPPPPPQLDPHTFCDSPTTSIKQESLPERQKERKKLPAVGLFSEGHVYSKWLKIPGRTVTTSRAVCPSSRNLPSTLLTTHKKNAGTYSRTPLCQVLSAYSSRSVHRKTRLHKQQHQISSSCVIKKLTAVYLSIYLI